MRLEKQIINIIFDAGKGKTSVASREAVVGEPLGILPIPKRSGYRFVGWKCGDALFDENTVLEAESDLLLVAQWEKAEGGRSRSTTRRQKIAIAILAATCVLLVVLLLVVNEIIKFETLELENIRYVNGEQVVDVYYIKHVDGAYQLFDKNGTPVKKNLDGYYIVEGGNQYKLDPATGEWSLFAEVDVEGIESIGTNGYVLIFEQIRQDDIYSIEVSGGTDENGVNLEPYRVYRDKAGDVHIAGTENSLVEYDRELYASLSVSCGYPIASKKLGLNSPSVPKINGKIDYSAFGLSDADNPRIYTITKAQFNKAGECLPDESVRYTVKVGNKTLPGGGYYVQLVGRETVYIVGTAIENTVLQNVEALVMPRIAYPMTMSTFLCVEDFLLMNVDLKGSFDANDPQGDPIVAFSYLDLMARYNTLSTSKPYIAETNMMEGYEINDTRASDMLTLLAEMQYVRCVKLGITQEALEKYGLDGKASYIEFASPVSDASGNITGTIYNGILISPKTPNGTYYVASIPIERTINGEKVTFPGYDMIVEVDQYYLSFLEWNLSDWYNPYFFTTNIANVSEMKFHINGKDYTFRLDNSQSFMFYEALDGTMKQVDPTVGTLTVDGSGNWNYLLNGTNYAVQCFDLSRGSCYFRIVDLSDRSVTYEPFREYRFKMDRNGCSTLEIFRDGREFEYVLSYLENGTKKTAKIYSLVYRDASGKDFVVYGKYSTGSGNEHVTDNYQHSYWKEVLDANGNYKWERKTFTNVANGLILADETGMTTKLYELDLATHNLLVYCDQFLGGKAHVNLLDYTFTYEYVTDKGTVKTKQIVGVENFRQFYSNLVGYTIQGDINEKEFMTNMLMSTDDYIKTHKEDASFSFSSADMAKNTNLYTILKSLDDGDLEIERQYWNKHNQRDIVVRFYRYADRKVMMTVELVERDENGNLLQPDAKKTVGKFYVLTEVLEMIENDLSILLNPEGKVPVSERA